MKCDVCLTKIPLGEARCPNCGFIMKKSHITTFDASGDDHGHIEVKQKLNPPKFNMPKYNKTIDIKTVQRNMRSHTEQTKKTILSVIVIFIVIIGVMVSSLFGFIFSEPDYSYVNELEEMTFEEIIENDYDEYDTVQTAIDYEDKILDYLLNNGYSDLGVSEYSSKYDDESSLYASFTINASKDNTYYYLGLSFIEGYLDGSEITISGEFNGNIDDREFQLKEEQIKDVASLIDLDNIYSLIKDSYVKMEKTEDSDHEYKYTNYDDMNIYMVENYYEGSDTYNYYYSIGTK